MRCNTNSSGEHLHPWSRECPRNVSVPDPRNGGEVVEGHIHNFKQPIAVPHHAEGKLNI